MLQRKNFGEKQKSVPSGKRAHLRCRHDYFAGLEQMHFIEGIQKIEERWTKCIELEGLVEK